jgi:hypothetical protein
MTHHPASPVGTVAELRRATSWLSGR